MSKNACNFASDFFKISIDFGGLGGPQNRARSPPEPNFLRFSGVVFPATNLACIFIVCLTIFGYFLKARTLENHAPVEAGAIFLLYRYFRYWNEKSQQKCFQNPPQTLPQTSQNPPKTLQSGCWKAVKKTIDFWKPIFRIFRDFGTSPGTPKRPQNAILSKTVAPRSAIFRSSCVECCWKAFRTPTCTQNRPKSI